MNKFTYTIPNILGRKDSLDCDNNCHFWNFSPTRCSARDSISGKHCMNASRCILHKARHGSIPIVQSWQPQLLWERWRDGEMFGCLTGLFLAELCCGGVIDLVTVVGWCHGLAAAQGEFCGQQWGKEVGLAVLHNLVQPSSRQQESSELHKSAKTTQSATQSFPLSPLVSLAMWRKSDARHWRFFLGPSVSLSFPGNFLLLLAANDWPSQSCK